MTDNQVLTLERGYGEKVSRQSLEGIGHVSLLMGASGAGSAGARRRVVIHDPEIGSASWHGVPPLRWSLDFALWRSAVRLRRERHEFTGVGICQVRWNSSRCDE